MKDLLIAALGAGLGLATVFFPLTWLAMRGQYKLGPLKGYGWAFAGTAAALAIVQALGFMEGLALLAAPVAVSALALYLSRPKT